MPELIGNRVECPGCKTEKPKVIKRELSPGHTEILCASCADAKRAITGNSGHQRYGTRPPVDNGEFTH